MARSRSRSRKPRRSRSYFRRLKHPMKNKQYKSKFERCVLKVKSRQSYRCRSRGYKGPGCVNPFAICHASLRRTTRRRSRR